MEKLKNGWLPDGGCQEEPDGGIVLDDAAYHLETIEEKKLPVNRLNAYNHLAIYLRWCMENGLMDGGFLTEYGEKTRTEPADAGLREFIRDELAGQLSTSLFSEKGRAFAAYYYGENDSPFFPSDIDRYAIGVIGEERNNSDEIQDEAYLFLPFDEGCYQAMAAVIQERFDTWQKDILEPSQPARAMMGYLGCACTCFPALRDDAPILSAYRSARQQGAQEGFVPILLPPDEALLESLMINAGPETAAAYRQKLLAAPIGDGKAVLEELAGQYGEEEPPGEPAGGYSNCCFSCYWDADTGRTRPLILAKIPVQNPWEIFAYLPFGGWNNCPDTPELMAVAKYWAQQYGAVPAAMTRDELEFALPSPVPGELAREAAAEQSAFCPDMDQIFDTPEAQADTLRQSTVWYFWWD